MDGLVNIRYTPNVKFAGKSGYDHHFDFVIPKSTSRSERIIEMVNYPQKNKVGELVFKWQDTRDARPPESQMFALLNDSQAKVPETVIEALNCYEIQTILWSNHQDIEGVLTA